MQILETSNLLEQIKVLESLLDTADSFVVNKKKKIFIKKRSFGWIIYHEGYVRKKDNSDWLYEPTTSIRNFEYFYEQCVYKTLLEAFEFTRTYLFVTQ